MWTHGVLRDEPGLKGLVRRTFYRLADGLLLYGQRAKQLLAAQGFDEKRLHVIYNSLDYEAQQQALAQIDPAVLAAARAQFGLDDNDRVIIAIARVTREKRFELLIEALALLTKTNPVYKLLVVGDGPYLQALRELAVKLKVDGQVFFCGASYDEVDIATKMSISDIAVVPGDVGLSCIHSLTYGLPMITHDKLDAHGPEFEAIIEGETGGFYAHGNVESLAALIDSWCTRMKAERRSIGERCQEVIAMHYTPAFQCQAIDSIVLEGR